MVYPGASSDGGPVSVLVIDDDVEMLHLLETLCGALGLDVCGAIQDPLKAIPAVVKVRPDIVLLDQTMPRISGAETAQIIRELVPEVRIVGLLGSAEQGPPGWCNASLRKTDLDQLSAILHPLLASVERERRVQEIRSEIAAVKASLLMTLREWKSLGDEGLRGLVGRATDSLGSMDVMAGRLVKEAREGRADIVTSHATVPEVVHGARARLTVALAEQNDSSHLAHIGLQHNDNVLLGEYEDASAENAVVAATLQAVRPLLDFDVRPLEIDFLQVGDLRIAVVVLDRSTDWLVGSALVRRDVNDSLARATLDAVNRFLKPVDLPPQPVSQSSSVAG